MAKDRIRILFVCHGNICRSTMAQCVMQHMVDSRGMCGRFTIDSVATTNEEIGMPIYPPARDKLKAEGVPTMVYYPRGIHQQTAYADKHFPDEWYPNTLAAANRILALPMHPYLTDADIDQVTAALKNAVQNV